MRPGPAVVLILSWFVAFNLRSGFVGLGPALPALTSDLELTFSQSSVLVSVPTLLMGLLLVAAGGGLRAAATAFPLLFVISILFGAGIGIAQPPLPRLMRAWFPQRLGVTTGVYASGMVCGSIVGASLSGLMLAQAGGHDAWRFPIALWGALAAGALLIWTVIMRPWRAEHKAVAAQLPSESAADVTAWSPWRDPRTWVAAAIFAAQGLVYYLLVAWLPAIYSEAGADLTATAALFTVFNASTLPGILLFPIWSDRLRQRRLPTIASALLFLIGVVGLLFVPFAAPWRWLWPALAGSGVAGVFGMSLVLPADIAPRGRTGAAAGMVLAVGYAAAALGPVIAGVVRDVSGSFDATLTLLPLVGVAMILLAVVTPERPTPIGE